MRTVVDCCGFSIAKNRPDKHNEDYFESYPNPESAAPEWADFVAVVADGVGSSDGPQDAARTAVQSWLVYSRAKFVENSAKCAGFDDIHFNEITTHAFSQAHEAVHKSTKGSACAVSACLQGDRLIIGNVGDCRIYRVRGTRLEQLSEDQVDAGGDPTQVIGGKRAPQPYSAAQAHVRAGDVIIMCTDGVWKLIEDSDFLLAAVGVSAQEISAKLQRTVMVKRGPASDDATAIVAVIKQVGSPFWETDSVTGIESGDDQLKEDMIETKLNEVLAELLNRTRAPLEKQNAKAEQAINDLGLAVSELRAEISALKHDAGSVRRGKRSGGETRTAFAGAGLSVLLVAAGVLLGWTLRQPASVGKPHQVGPKLPPNAKIVSQEYQNDRLFVKFKGGDDKFRLAVFRLEDGGKPFAIIDLPSDKKPNVTVP